MKTISLTHLRAHLSSAIQQVRKGKSIVITSHGKPIAHIVPPSDHREEAKAAIKALRKTAIIGDVVSPTIIETWDSD